jgi:uncharacterized membrane protein HdeD (DUF308 family)
MSEEDEKKLLKDTIDEERLQVCSMARRLGSKLSGLMFASGILVFAFGLYLMFAPQDPVLSARVSIIFTGALVFIAVLNILCGLLLLLGED